MTYICRYCRTEVNNHVMDLVQHLAVRHGQFLTPNKALFYYEINGKLKTFSNEYIGKD